MTTRLSLSEPLVLRLMVIICGWAQNRSSVSQYLLPSNTCDGIVVYSSFSFFEINISPLKKKPQKNKQNNDADARTSATSDEIENPKEGEIKKIN